MVRSRRAALACAVAALAAPPGPAADPAPPAGRVDRVLAVQAAIAEAREHLTAHKPALAVAVLERHLAAADGSRAYLDTLRSAYAAESKRLQQANADPARVADVKAKLALLGGAGGPEPPAPPAVPVPPPAGLPAPVVPPPAAATPAPAAPAGGGFDPAGALKQAAALFNGGAADAGNYGRAAKLFAAVALSKGADLTPQQQAQWAYCRVRLAAEKLNRAGADPAAAAEVAAEVDDAVKLAPDNPKLRDWAAGVAGAARQRAGGPVARAPAADPSPPPAPAPAPAGAGGEVVETASFRVRHPGGRAAAEALAVAAEAKRAEVFGRWSGPPGGPWGPKCEVTVHPSAGEFARATGLPAGATGRAVVNLDGGRPVGRAIDLRADDETAAADALPRELTYVVLADLFPDKAPPKWAEAGMAALACSPAEVDRYRRALRRAAQAGGLFPLDALLDAPAPPADRVTEFAVGSLSVVDFLVRWKGEKAFTGFVRDAHRYGQPAALRRQYGVADARQLEGLWTRSELGSARGQAAE